MNYKNKELNKAKWWQEIKSLEQEYKGNISQIQQIEERQSDISFEIQKRIDKIQKEGEEYDQYCWENKLGEFSEINCVKCEPSEYNDENGVRHFRCKNCNKESNIR